MSRFRRFRHGESGAVTADWVVLSAAVIIAAAATLASVKNGALALAPVISEEVSAQLPEHGG